MYRVVSSANFRRDYKRMFKRGYNLDLLDYTVQQLASGIPLPGKYRDHALSGNWTGYRECHITPDWLLVYRIKNDILVLMLTRTGSHSDLF